MSKNLINRYIWLVDTIYQAGSEGITLSEISKKWEKNDRLSGGEEYPRRTFMNHKKDIWDIFGIEIGCHKFSNSYYIVDPLRQDNRFRYLYNNGQLHYYR